MYIIGAINFRSKLHPGYNLTARCKLVVQQPLNLVQQLDKLVHLWSKCIHLSKIRLGMLSSRVNDWFVAYAFLVRFVVASLTLQIRVLVEYMTQSSPSL